MQKRMLAFILMLATITCCFISCGKKKELQGSCGENLTWSFHEKTGTLTIMGSGSMDNYTKGSAPWYWCAENIQTVTFYEGVTDIGSYAFYGCTGLIIIEFPNGVNSIGSHAFSGCTDLVNVEFSDWIASIGDYAFSDCTDLININIPQSIKNMGEHVFFGCTDLEGK